MKVKISCHNDDEEISKVTNILVLYNMQIKKVKIDIIYSKAYITFIIENNELLGQIINIINKNLRYGIIIEKMKYKRF
jgi:hypothetical protein